MILDPRSGRGHGVTSQHILHHDVECMLRTDSLNENLLRIYWLFPPHSPRCKLPVGPDLSPRSGWYSELHRHCRIVVLPFLNSDWQMWPGVTCRRLPGSLQSCSITMPKRISFRAKLYNITPGEYWRLRPVQPKSYSKIYVKLALGKTENLPGMSWPMWTKIYNHSELERASYHLDVLPSFHPAGVHRWSCMRSKVHSQLSFLHS